MKNGTARSVRYAVFFLYLLFMLWLLFDRSPNWDSALSYGENLRQNRNLVPFFTIRRYLMVISRNSNPYLVRHCFINLVGNVLLFIPWGLMVPALYRPFRRFIPFFLLSAGTILAVELLQLFTLLGRLDVDDLILNLCGMLLGYILLQSARWCRKLQRNRHERDTVI